LSEMDGCKISSSIASAFWSGSNLGDRSAVVGSTDLIAISGCEGAALGADAETDDEGTTGGVIAVAGEVF